VSKKRTPKPTVAQTAAPSVLQPRVEVVAGLLLTAAVIFLQVTTWLNAGPLWRDEATSASVAAQPTFSAMLAAHPWDSCPCLLHILLRSWAAVGFGSSDFSLRAFGLLTGLGTLGLLWWGVRQFGGKAPLLALVLLSLNPTMLLYGASVRGYGLGVFTMLLTLITVWRLVSRFSWWRAAAALGAALLCVQSLFTNSTLLLAICLAGAALALRRREWKTVLVVLAIGFVAGLTVLPYVVTIGGLDFGASASKYLYQVITENYPLGQFIMALKMAIRASADWMLWVWGPLTVAGLLGSAWLAFRPAKPTAEPVPQRDRSLFFLVALVTATIAFFTMLFFSKVPTQPWYYVTIMALAALCLDAGLGPWVRRRTPAALAWPVAVVLLAGLLFPQADETLHVRMTNIDLVCRQLKTQADPNDLILVNPFYIGVTVGRYYDGPAPVTTVPETAKGLRFQVYDECRTLMTEDRPLDPLLQRIRQTLKSGHRVWIIGWMQFLRPGETPGALPPAPQAPSGWLLAPYQELWTRQVAYLLQSHAVKVGQVPVPAPGPVLHYEDVQLLVVDGWHD
jgi:hypothetical protein